MFEPFILPPVSRRELLNTILFHYELHNEVIAGNKCLQSERLFLQVIQSLYRKGRYGEICQRVAPIASSLKKANTAFTPAIALDLLYYYATALYFNQQHTLAQQHAQQMYQLAREVGNTSSQVDALIHLGAGLFNAWELAEAKAYYTKAARLLRRHPHIINQARVTSGIADIQFMQGCYRAALRSYLRVLTIYAKVGSNYNIAQTEYNIGICYYQVGNLSAANKYLLLSEGRYRDVIQQANKADKNLIYSLHGLALVALKQHDFQLADRRLAEAISYLPDCLGHPLYFETYLLYLSTNYRLLSSPKFKAVLQQAARWLKHLPAPTNSHEQFCATALTAVLTPPADPAASLLDYERFIHLNHSVAAS